MSNNKDSRFNAEETAAMQRQMATSVELTKFASVVQIPAELLNARINQEKDEYGNSEDEENKSDYMMDDDDHTNYHSPMEILSDESKQTTTALKTASNARSNFLLKRRKGNHGNNKDDVSKDDNEGHKQGLCFLLCSILVYCAGIAVSLIFYQCVPINKTYHHSQERKPILEVLLVGSLVCCSFIVSWMRECIITEQHPDNQSYYRILKRQLSSSSSSSSSSSKSGGNLKAYLSFTNLFVGDADPKNSAHHNDDDEKLDIFERIQRHQWSKQSTVHIIRRNISPIITEAFEYECDSRNITAKEDRRELAYHLAVQHIRESARYEDIISKCQSICRVSYSQWLKKMFELHHSYLWVYFIHFVVICHICLSFWESSLRPQYHLHYIPIGKLRFDIGINVTFHDVCPEILCLLFELMDVILRMLWFNICPHHILRPKHERIFAKLEFIIIIYIIVDLILNLSLEISLEYIIPVRPLLLILINPRLRSELTTLIKSIYDLIPILKLYFLVVLTCGVFALSLFGHHHRTSSSDDQNHQDQDQDQDQEEEEDVLQFENKMLFILRSTLTMFVFVSSGENYTEVVYPAINQYRSSLIVLFFVPIIFFGILTLMALITGIFEDSYTKRESYNRKRDRWWKRIGPIASFELLTLINYHHSGGGGGSDSCCLNHNDFVQFCSFLRSDVDLTQLDQLFHYLDKDHSGAIDLEEFVTGIEELNSHLFLSNRRSINKTKKKKKKEMMDAKDCDDSDDTNDDDLRQRLESVMNGPMMYKLRMGILCVNYWVASWMNIVNTHFIIDLILYSFVLFHSLDIMIKIYSMTLTKYWYLNEMIHPTSSSSEEEEEKEKDLMFYLRDSFQIEQLANRMDLILTLISWIISTIWIILLSISMMMNNNNPSMDESTHWMRFGLVLILLRSFILWPSSMRLAFMLKAALSSLISLLVIMFCVFFMYGVIGVSMFGSNQKSWNDAVQDYEYMQNRRDHANDDHLSSSMDTNTMNNDSNDDEMYSNPRGNFDNLTNAFILLVQGFVGEAFHEIMFATKDSIDEQQWFICLYIVSYFIVVTLLFANLFFGLLLSIFGSLYAVHQSGRRLTHSEVMRAKMLDDGEEEEDEEEEDGQGDSEHYEPVDYTKKESISSIMNSSLNIRIQSDNSIR